MPRPNSVGNNDARTVVIWEPQKGPQTHLLTCPVFEVFYGGARGGGKLLSLEEYLPTPEGFIQLKDLKVGDHLFDEQGNICSVLELHPIQNSPESYEVIFDDGTIVSACGEHLWVTFTKKERISLKRRTEIFRENRKKTRPLRAKLNSRKPWVSRTITELNKIRKYNYLDPPKGTIRTTKQILKTLHYGEEINHAVQITKPLSLPHKKFLISPYCLGAWLGDGNSRNGGFTSADMEVLDQFKNVGYRVRHSKKDKYYHHVYGLTSELKTLGLLQKKHIPPDYLRGSKEERLALLQGLMDTDGCVCKSGGVEFCNTNKRIIDGIYDLICSLGWKATVKEGRSRLNGIDKGPKWTIRWTPDDYVFRLPRKKNNQKLAKGYTTKWRYIVAIKPIPPVPMRCIKVNSQSNLFLCSKSYVPTHNTDGVLGDWASHAQRYADKANGLMFRRERTELFDTIRRSKELYIPLKAQYNEQSHVWTFPNGATLRFAYLERDSDAESYQGHSYTRLYPEELGNFPNPAPILKMFATCRSAHGVPVGIRATGNPGGPGHSWVRQRYVDPYPLGYKVFKDPHSGLERVYIPAKVSDNPILTTNDPQYVNRLKASGSPELVRAWLEGDWTVIAGAYFSEFALDKHVIAPIELSQSFTRFRCFDWGSAHPFACLWIAVSDGSMTEFPKGALIVYRELYGHSDINVGLKLPVEEVGAMIKSKEIDDKLSYSVADPAIFKQDGGPSIAERLHRCGLIFRHADNSRIAGWDSIRQRLLGQDGKPMLYIFSTCVHTIRTLPALQHDENRPEDVDSDGEDHLADALRYGCMSRPYSRPLPKNEPIKDMRSVTLDDLWKQQSRIKRVDRL